MTYCVDDNINVRIGDAYNYSQDSFVTICLGEQINQHFL